MSLIKIYKTCADKNIVITEEQANDLKLLFSDYRYTKKDISVIIKQLQYGLTDLYGRNIKLMSLTRDSSSLSTLCLRYGEIEGIKLFNEKNSKTCNTLENFIKRYGVELGKEKFKHYGKIRPLTLENCIRRDPINGEQFYKDYWHKNNFGNSLDAYIRKYGDIIGKEKYDVMRQRCSYTNTENYYIETFGEVLGKEKFRKRYDPVSYKNSKKYKIQQLLEDGHTIDDIKYLLIGWRDNTSLSSYIKRYGENDGKEKYTAHIEKIAKSGFKSQTNNYFSKEANKVLTPIIDILKTKFNSNNILFEKTEYKIKLNELEKNISTGFYFQYDLTDLDNNLIIEYHGEKYHDKVDYQNTEQLTYEYFNENYNRDLFKKFIAEQRNFKVFIIRSWERKKDLFDLYEYLNNKQDITEWLHNFI